MSVLNKRKEKKSSRVKYVIYSKRYVLVSCSFLSQDLNAQCQTLLLGITGEVTDILHLQDNASSLASRAEKTDAAEIDSFYYQYYEHYVRALDQGEKADRYSRTLLF